jgi:hypothetical protein
LLSEMRVEEGFQLTFVIDIIKLLLINLKVKFLIFNQSKWRSRQWLFTWIVPFTEEIIELTLSQVWKLTNWYSSLQDFHFSFICIGRIVLISFLLWMIFIWLMIYHILFWTTVSNNACWIIYFILDNVLKCKKFSLKWRYNNCVIIFVKENMRKVKILMMVWIKI